DGRALGDAALGLDVDAVAAVAFALIAGAGIDVDALGAGPLLGVGFLAVGGDGVVEDAVIIDVDGDSVNGDGKGVTSGVAVALGGAADLDVVGFAGPDLGDDEAAG